MIGPRSVACAWLISRATFTILLALVAPVLAKRAGAQNFAPAEPPGPASSGAALLERGLPDARGALAFEALATSWLGVPDLATRAACVAVPIHSLRFAAGISRTGAAELGWSAAGLAAGASGPAGGAAVRAIARRDDDPAARLDPGLEAGGGAWVRAGRRARIWASAPQLWTRGAPPLPQGLVIGASFQSDGVEAWLERQAPARAADDNGRHDAGLALDLGPARAWVEAREQPLRAAVGVEIAARRWSVRVRVESHPVLGETVSLALAGGARAERTVESPP